jgi:hypothetical protein
MDPNLNAQPAAAAAQPASWPGAFGAFKPSKTAVMLNLMPILVMILVLFGVSIIVQMLTDNMVIDNVLATLVSSFATGALTFAYLESVRGRKVSHNETFAAGVKYFVNIFVASILTLILLGISLVLLIVPFFFVLPRLFLVDYFIVDKNMGAIESIKASWAATKGHSLKVWGIIGVSVLMILLMITIIGIPVALYLLLMYSAVWAVLYLFITKNDGSTASAPQSQPTVASPPPVAPSQV